MVMDSDLFLRFREGNEAAFRQIFNAHYRDVTYFAGIFLKDDLYAEDIACNIFQKAWENREKFASGPHLVNFLYQVTRNDCINYRNKERVKKTDYGESALFLADTADDELPFDLKRTQTALVARLCELLENAPSPTREVLRMSFFEHKTAKEIARELQLTESNVYTIKSRAYEKFRTILSKELWALFVLLFGGL